MVTMDDVTTLCSDTNADDTITYDLYFDGTVVATLDDAPPTRLRQLGEGGYVIATMDALISFDSTSKKIKIGKAIKNEGANTYQFTLTCKD